MVPNLGSKFVRRVLKKSAQPEVALSLLIDECVVPLSTLIDPRVMKDASAQAGNYLNAAVASSDLC